MYPMQGFCLFIHAMDGKREILRTYLLELGRDLFNDWVLTSQYAHTSPRHYRGDTKAIKLAIHQCIKERLQDFEYMGLKPHVKYLKGEIIWLDFILPQLNNLSAYQAITAEDLALPII